MAVNRVYSNVPSLQSLRSSHYWPTGGQSNLEKVGPGFTPLEVTLVNIMNSVSNRFHGFSILVMKYNKTFYYLRDVGVYVQRVYSQMNDRSYLG